MQNETEKLTFIAIDGDDVGPKLRSYIIKNDIEGAAHFSLNLENHFQSLRTWLHNRKFTIVFCGGDSILAYNSLFSVNQAVNELPQGFWPYSVGIGVSAEIAYLALQLAKARGKSQAVVISDVNAETIKVWNKP
jgi:GTP cyclohydrolase III